MKRYDYDLTHFSLQTSKIGRLSGLSTIPVVAGDSFDATITSVVNMSPLRRQLTIDARFDIFGFFIPHRWIYPGDFETFIESGVDESVTFTGTTPNVPCHFYGLGSEIDAISTPKWVIAGYNKIWNRWFRIPNDTGSELAETYTPSALGDESRYGYATAYLPSYLTGSDTYGADSADYEYTLSASNLNLIDLERLKARYKTELDRSWFTERYSEILKRNFTGAMISSDAEERPELLFRKTTWMSGHDVSGTDEGSLGSTIGRSQGVVQTQMPRKFFKEHGTIWILFTMRYPTIVPEHCHYLATTVDPSYKEWAGDPRILEAEPPIKMEYQDFIHNSTDTTQMNYYPYAQWYRTHPNVVHKDLEELKGFPFLENTDIAGGVDYIDSADYDSSFANLAQAHYSVYSKVSMGAKRIIPPSISSIYAGV
jgi:hypothetical protein